MRHRNLAKRDHKNLEMERKAEIMTQELKKGLWFGEGAKLDGIVDERICNRTE
jgi:hypothetical protein